MYPVLLQLGSFKLKSWGTMVVIAFIAAVLVTVIRARKYKIPPIRVKTVLHYLIFVIIAGFVGARLFCVFEHLTLFLRHPGTILSLQHGGFSWYGGLVFASICGFLCLKKGGFRIKIVGDIVAPGIAIGIFLGRIGCFLNGCCFGKPTNMPWGVVFPTGSYPTLVYGPMVKLHPTQLYAAFASLLSFFILLGMERRLKFRPDGLLFVSFLILYGLWRFIIEFFRWHEPNLYIVGWFTVGQAFSIGVIIFATFLIYLEFKLKRITTEGMEAIRSAK